MSSAINNHANKIRYLKYVRCNECEIWIPRIWLDRGQIFCKICHNKLSMGPKDRQLKEQYKAHKEVCFPEGPMKKNH